MFAAAPCAGILSAINYYPCSKGSQVWQFQISQCDDGGILRPFDLKFQWCRYISSTVLDAREEKPIVVAQLGDFFDGIFLFS